jgi:cytosine/creatinine deaminase
MSLDPLESDPADDNAPIAYDIVLRRGRLVGREGIWDLGISGDRLVAIDRRLPGRGLQEWPIEGQLISPPFVESHIHLDSALTAGSPRPNLSGTLFEGIQIWADRKQSLTLEDVQERAIATLRQQAAQGVLFVRSHADVSEQNLIALQGLLAVREQVRDWITLQVVAFPQDGIFGHPRNRELLEESLRLGADLVGGIPHYELTREDGVASIGCIFDLAEQYDRPIDIHCDEIDDEQSRFLEVVAAAAYRRDYGPRVSVSHTTAFGSYNNAYALKLMGLLQRAQINFIANPLINITLQGRTDSYPKRRGLTRVKELWQAGLNVSLGHDCIQDPWYSLGTGNMLEVAQMAIHVAQMTGQAEQAACYEMVTANGAKTLQLADYGLNLGDRADLIVLDAPSIAVALRDRSAVTLVISRGQLLLSRSRPILTWNPASNAVNQITKALDS